MMLVLIMGLPGSGKSTLACELVKILSLSGKSVQWLNADAARKASSDWDFSDAGRIRQAERLKSRISQRADVVFIDFVAAIAEQRNIVNPDLTIWMNTIEESRYEDTNKRFEKPDNVDIVVTSVQTDLTATVEVILSCA